MTRHLSIRLLAPLILVLPVAIVASAILIITSRAAEKTAYTQAVNELNQIQSTVIDRVNALVAAPISAVELNKGLLDNNQLDPHDPESWRDTLINQSRVFPMLSSITWGSRDGQSTWLARYAGQAETSRVYAILTTADNANMREYTVSPEGDVSPQPTNTFTFDPRVRPWYTAAIEAAAPTWSPPFVWAGETGDPTIGLSYVRPYETEGDLYGVLCADLSLNDISTYLATLRIAKSGSCFIVDGDHRLIATSTAAPILNHHDTRLKAAHSLDPTIAAVADHLLTERSTDPGVETQSPASTTLTTPEGKLFTILSPVGRPAGLDWAVVTIVPEADFMAAAHQAQHRTIVTGLVIIGLTTIAGLFISRWLAAPVLTLESHATKIGQGDFEATIDLNQTTEYSRLSRAINAMSADLEDRIQLRRSLATAMEVQQNLLPRETPDLKGIEIAGKSNYCDQTGGDYYDFLDISGLSQNTAAIVIGDVMGHGIAAAMLMATARGILRSRCTESGSTGELMTHLNELLVEVTEGHRFMTMIMATLDQPARQLRWAGAGHDPPFIYDPATGQFLELEGGGLPLGVMAGETYEENTVENLPDGAVIVLVTDGIFEAHNPEGDMYGKDRIKQLIIDHHADPAETIAANIEHSLKSFQNGAPQEDDITYVIVKLTDS